MQTAKLDYILSSLCIFFLLCFTAVFVAIIKNVAYLIFQDFAAIALVLIFLLAYGLSTALFLWVLRKLYPFAEGRYKMTHQQFTLWKLHAVLMQLGQPCVSLFIPIFLRPVLFYLFGAVLGKQIAIGGKLLDPFLITMKDYAVIGEDSVVTGHIMTNDNFILGKVVIGDRATIGVKSFIMPSVKVGENAIVLPGSVVSMGTQIPPNEIWGGNPAVRIRENSNLPSQS